MSPFGNEDPIDKIHRVRINELKEALTEARHALEKGCAITMREREEVLSKIRKVL